MQGNVLGQAGANLKINGIIEEYKVASGGNIRGGDFVKFIDNYRYGKQPGYSIKYNWNF